MADNVPITAGTGTDVATDDVAGKHHQRVKLSLGADGIAVDAGAGAGVVGTDTQRVTLGSDDPAVVALQIIDDWDETDRAKVNVIVGQAGIAGGTGLDGATVPRVTLATNVALPAGTNAIGKLAANSGVDIGDVDVTSIAAGDNNIGNVDIVTVPADPFGVNADAASATGSISAKLRFIAATGIPVTGSVAVTNAGTFATQVDGAALTALQLIDDPVVVLGTATYTETTSKGNAIAAVRRDADTTLVDTTNEFGPLQMDANGRLKVEAFDGGDSHTVDAPVGTPVFVRLSDGSAAIATLPVSLASVPSHAVTNAGTFAVQVDGSALTALQLIDDTVFAEDVAATAADKGIAMLAVRRDADTTLVDTTNDYANLQVDANGYLKVEIFDGGGSHTVDVASGGIASGAIASGAVASGAFASGSIGSGAIASGAIASGAIASGAIASGAIAAGAIAAGATAIAANEDDASNDLDRGVKVLAVRKGTPANTSGTDGDYEFFQISAGRVWSSANIDQINGVTPLMGSGATGTGSHRVTAATDSPEVTALQIMDDWDSSDAAKTVGHFATVSTGVTRPADTNIYAANDCLSDSTSAPTSGGFTFTGAGRISGGSGIITDMWVTSSNDPATLLQGEIWIADSAVTNVNDNAAFASSDADTLLSVAVIPFTMLSTVAGSGTTSYAHVQNLSIGFTCVGTANLRFKVKVKNAYTPASAEVLTFRLKIVQTT